MRAPIECRNKSIPTSQLRKFILEVIRDYTGRWFSFNTSIKCRNRSKPTPDIVNQSRKEMKDYMGRRSKRNQLDLRDLHSSLKHCKRWARTSYRSKESYWNLLGEESDESLQVSCLLSIFLYHHFFLFFFFSVFKCHWSGRKMSSLG